MLYLWVVGTAARDFHTTLYSSANKSGSCLKSYIMVCRRHILYEFIWYNSMLSHSLQEMRWEPATYCRNLGVVTLLYIPPLQSLASQSTCSPSSMIPLWWVTPIPGSAPHSNRRGCSSTLPGCWLFHQRTLKSNARCEMIRSTTPAGRLQWDAVTFSISCITGCRPIFTLLQLSGIYTQHSAPNSAHTLPWAIVRKSRAI